MKLSNGLSISLFLIIFTWSTATAQTEKTSKQKNKERVLVTFECESCTKRNRFKISGPESHLFIKTHFPIEQELRPGEYEMTYWQNKVQQIHLPFSVDPGIENIIVVKE